MKIALIILLAPLAPLLLLRSPGSASYLVGSRAFSYSNPKLRVLSLLTSVTLTLYQPSNPTPKFISLICFLTLISLYFLSTGVCSAFIVYFCKFIGFCFYVQYFLKGPFI